jgi:hypothetical protein
VLNTPVLMSPIYDFLRDVWIRTPASVTSRRATNLATHPSILLFTFQIFEESEFSKQTPTVYLHEQCAGIQTYVAQNN